MKNRIKVKGGDAYENEGGSVILKPTKKFKNFKNLSYRYHYRAEDGIKKNVPDLKIKVPLYTMVFEDKTGEILKYLNTPDKHFIQ